MGVVGSAKVSASRMVIEILPVVIRAAQLNVHGWLAHPTTGGVAAWNEDLSGEMQAAGKRGWEELAFLGLHYCWYLGTVFAYLPVLKALTFVVLSQARTLPTPAAPPSHQQLPPNGPPGGRLRPHLLLLTQRRPRVVRHPAVPIVSCCPAFGQGNNAMRDCGTGR